MENEIMERNETEITNNGQAAGKSAATASLVLGLIGVVLWWFGYSAILSVGTGIAGLICAGNAKKAGYDDGMRTAGFILSLISLIVGGIVFAACVACAGGLASLGLGLGTGALY